MADDGVRAVRGCLIGLAIVSAFWIAVPIVWWGWVSWPWPGTVWVVIYAGLVAAWPVWELGRYLRRRGPRNGARPPGA